MLTKIVQLLTLFLLFCWCLAFPPPGSAAVTLENVLTGSDDVLPYVAVDPEGEIIFRDAPLREMMKSFIEEAKQQMAEIRTKADCIRIRTDEASKETSEDLKKVRKCSMRTAEGVSGSLSSAVAEFQENIFDFIRISADLATGLMKCATHKERFACNRKVVSASETSYGRVACSIKTSLSRALDSWRSLTRDLRSCLASGVQDVSAVQVKLREQILQCIE